MLERKYPAKYGRRDRTAVDVDALELAKGVADELGVPVSEVMAEAQDILAKEAERKRREA